MKAVRMMVMAVEGDPTAKILVHCHAGRGRTGMVIASYLVLADKMTASDAIALFRSRREKRALDSKKQQKVIYDFEKCNTLFFLIIDILECSRIFRMKKKEELTITKVLEGQNFLNKFSNTCYEKFVPIIIKDCFIRIQEILTKNKLSPSVIFSAFCHISSKADFDDIWDDKMESQLHQFMKNINHRQSIVAQITDLRYTAQLILEFFERLSLPAIPQTFFLQYAKIFEEEDRLINFMNGKEPHQHSYKNKVIYNVLSIICKALREVIGTELIESTEFEHLLLEVLYRFAFSLLKTRKKNDSMFVKRDIVLSKQLKSLESESMLVKLMKSWIKNFDESMRSNYFKLKRPLNTFLEKTKSTTSNYQDMFTSAIEGKDNSKSSSLNSSFFGNVAFSRVPSKNHSPLKTNGLKSIKESIKEGNLSIIEDYLDIYFQRVSKDVQELVLSQIEHIMERPISRIDNQGVS